MRVSDRQGLSVPEQCQDVDVCKQGSEQCPYVDVCKRSGATSVNGDTVRPPGPNLTGTRIPRRGEFNLTGSLHILSN